ncbi:MAG: hypothetical protein O6761_06935 [Thaumarchaeota archaeon]|nr:hypothetical protein [Nitrososphaerota archaeon]
MIVDDNNRIFVEVLREEFKEFKKDIKEEFGKIDEHLEKTCDEIKEVTKQVINLKANFNNHLTNVNEKQLNKRERAFLALTIISALIAGIALFT